MILQFNNRNLNFRHLKPVFMILNYELSLNTGFKDFKYLNTNQYQILYGEFTKSIFLGLESPALHELLTLSEETN